MIIVDIFFSMGLVYGQDRSLKETPSWAVALVSVVFVVISVLIEHSIHSLGMWFQKRRKKAMSEALEKIKAELMLLGFISLLLTVGSGPISKICISTKAGQTMLPCKKENYHKADHQTRNLPTSDQYCSLHGKMSLISRTGLHQLHIFIFALAVFHVLYSIITMALAQAKLKKWKAWELDTTSLEYELKYDPSRFRFASETSFIRRHSGFATKPGLKWIVAFLRQFFSSVTKVDYLTLRCGFINAHFAPNTKFDFHKYIKRSMEDDFKVVVGISLPLWIFATIFQLINVYSWYTLISLSFLPAAILLLVGTKLELIIMDMAEQIQEKTEIIKGAPVVEPNDSYFWLNQPHLLLFLLHFTLFENAFQMAYFMWTWYEFGIRSCFHENLATVLAKVFLGIAFQVICSYITFPLYALVTQMGSHMKRSIFEEQAARALKKWHKSAKEKNKLMKKAGRISSFKTDNPSLTRGSLPDRMLRDSTQKSVNLQNTIVTCPPKLGAIPETEILEVNEGF